MAERTLSPRLERVNGVAAVTVQGGLRRQIRVDLSKEKITALGLPVDRIVQVLRTENQNIPVGEINEGSLTYLVRSPGQFNNLDEIRNLVVLTREGVPVYMRDIADVRDGTEDFRSVHARQRPAGRADARHEAVGREHGGHLRSGAQGDLAHQPRGARRAACRSPTTARCSSSSRSPRSAKP